jgi:hypothetical protein
MRKSATLTAVAALLGACSSLGPPEVARTPGPVPQPKAAAPRARAVRIDNTSLESFRASWQRLRASLSPAQQANLQNAVARLTFEPYGGATDLPRNLRDSPIVPEIIRDRIAGLTYAEIIELSL